MTVAEAGLPEDTQRGWRQALFYALSDGEKPAPERKRRRPAEPSSVPQNKSPTSCPPVIGLWREIEDCVIRILVDALTSPARLLERLDTSGMPGDQIRSILGRAARAAAALSDSPAGRTTVVHRLVEKVIVDEKTLTIKVRRGPLLGGGVPSSASEDASDNTIELTAAVAFKRRGVETKLALPGLAQRKRGSRCDPALIKAIARGRAWFEELATGRARSLQELAKREGITRRYIRRLLCLAFLSPELVEAILQGRQPVELTATRLSELDLPMDWTEQHRLLAS
jgi:site-specific DNA recombinase